MAKWVGEVQDADRLPEYVARAFHTALQGRPGPVVLVLPEDMLTQTVDVTPLPRVEPVQAWSDPGALRTLRELLLQAERPLVIAGGGGWTPQSAAALQRFAENWQLPVANAFRFQDCFDNHHPNYAGDIGLGINPALAARVRESDLLIAIGPRLGEMTSGGYTLQGPGGETLAEGQVGETLTWGENASAGRLVVHTLEAKPGAHFTLLRQSRQAYPKPMHPRLDMLEAMMAAAQQQVAGQP